MAADKASLNSLLYSGFLIGTSVAVPVIPYVAPKIAAALAPYAIPAAAQLAEKGKQLVGRPTTREALLQSATNPKLRNAINELYRAGAKFGDGGAAMAARYQLQTGRLIGGVDHVNKAIQRIRNLENVIRNQNLNPSDLEIAQNLIVDLRKALSIGGIAP